MARGDNTYSRVVAWLKVLLPLMALGILSTMFLLSRSVEPIDQIPFSEGDLANRAAREQVTAPFFAAMTDRGDAVTVSADSARPDRSGQGRLIVEQLYTRINLTEGAEVTFRADSGSIDDPGDNATLEGNVVVRSDNGYRIETEQLSTRLRSIAAETDGEIAGTGPLGEFSAGRMELRPTGDNDLVQLVFTNGVKLVYRPKTDG